MSNQYVVVKTTNSRGVDVNDFQTIDPALMPDYEKQGYRLWAEVDSGGQDVASYPVKSAPLLNSFLSKLQSPITVGGQSIPLWAAIAGGTGALGVAGLGASVLANSGASDLPTIVRMDPEAQAEFDQRSLQFLEAFRNENQL